MVRRSLLVAGVAGALCLLLLTPPAGAQLAGAVFPNGGVDPFAFYYGYYLPHQAAIAAQATPLDTLNQITAQRQVSALQQRQGLYDPISPYGEEELDPNTPYSGRRGTERLAHPGLFPVTTSNLRGAGPAAYYGSTRRYFPTIRTGRGPNRNIGVTRRGGGMMGGGMMGGGGMGMPGGMGGIGPR
jgi:hypothetical protein